MGRHLVEDVEIKNHFHSRRVWNFILHVLDSHLWYNPKKMIPHRKHRRGRFVKCCANPKTISMEHVCSEEKGLIIDDESACIDPVTSCSAEACKKRVVFKEKEKAHKHKHRTSGSSLQRQLQRTDSIHHLEPSSYGLSWMNPIILVHKKADSSNARFGNSSLPKTLEKPVSGIRGSDSTNSFNKIRGNSKNESDHQVKEHVDVLEIFKGNTELFLEIMQDPKVGISKHFCGTQTSNTKTTLTKSGSFPAANSPGRTSLRLTTLDHKQNEVWSFSKGEKALSNGRGTPIHETGFSSQGSSHQAWNQFVMNHFKDIKQRIKQAIKEKRKRNSKNLVGHSGKAAPPFMLSDDEVISVKPGKTTMEQDCIRIPSDGDETNASTHGLKNVAFSQVKRTASLNESLGRYSQLFEQSFSRDAKQHLSTSLSLANEDTLLSRERTPKFFRRVSSLSGLESFISILNEVSRDTDMENGSQSAPKSPNVPVGAEKTEPAEVVLNTELEKKTKEKRVCSSTDLSAEANDQRVPKPAGPNEDAFESTIEKSDTYQEQETELFRLPGGENLQPDHFVPYVCSTDEIAMPEERPVSEGPELNPSGIDTDETESHFISQERQSADSSASFCSTSVHEDNANETNITQPHLLDKETDACSNYVRLVLNLSGFIGNESFATWHSLDQPLSPSLLKELETSYDLEEIPSNHDHQILFDLVNESLVEIYDRAPVYFPKGFSFSSGVCSMPEGSQLAEQASANVRSKLSFTPVQEQSLDDVVARDFTKDGWMNVQMEGECLALDLEDVIFDELLDEIIWV